MSSSLLGLPLSGSMLVWVAGYSLHTLRLLLAMALSVLLIIAYIFRARLEHRLFHMAGSASRNGDAAFPAQYDLFRKAAPIGGAALMMSLAAIILMVFKPF